MTPARILMFFSSPGVSFWTPKMGPKWGPNRNFDAEGVRKPPGSLLERSWTLLEPKKVIGDRLLGALPAILEPKYTRHIAYPPPLLPYPGRATPAHPWSRVSAEA